MTTGNSVARVGFSPTTMADTGRSLGRSRTYDLHFDFDHERASAVATVATTRDMARRSLFHASTPVGVCRDLPDHHGEHRVLALHHSGDV